MLGTQTKQQPNPNQIVRRIERDRTFIVGFDFQIHCRTTLSKPGPRVIEIFPKQLFCCTSTAVSFFSTSSVWNLAATCLRWLRATRSANATSLRLFSAFWTACRSWPDRLLRIRTSSSFSPSYNKNTRKQQLYTDWSIVRESFLSREKKPISDCHYLQGRQELEKSKV